MDVEKSFDMKQLTILSGRCLVVELPEWDTNPRMFPDTKQPICLFDHPDGWDCIRVCDLPPGNWRIIGQLSKLRGDDIAGLIEPVKVFDYTAHYWNYNEEEYQPIMPEQSLESAILAAGWYFDNPYKNEPLLKKLPSEIDEHIERFTKAQSRVLDRSRCLLLGREI